MMKKYTIYFTIFFASIAFFNTDIFASLVKDFESENVHFVPFSESNRSRAIAVLMDPTYYPPSFNPSDESTSNEFITAHISTKNETPLGAWVLFEKGSNKVIGVANFKGGNKYYDYKSDSSKHAYAIEAGGLKKDLQNPALNNYTELGSGKVRLSPDYQYLKANILDTLINYAFDAEPELNGIDFGTRDADTVGVTYALDRKMPYAPAPFREDGITKDTMPYKIPGTDILLHVFRFSRDFYNQNTDLFK